MEKEKRKKVFDKTDGNCHICHEHLDFSNYGKVGVAGAWQIDHSKAKAKGGSDHMNNLFAAHSSCNGKKGIASSRKARATHGKTRAPYSAKKKSEIKTRRGWAGAIIGTAIGSLTGPIGLVLLAGSGTFIGRASAPSK